MSLLALTFADPISTSHWAYSYFFVVLGIIMSVILPILRGLLPQPPTTKGLSTWWDRTKPYLIVGTFSLAVALLILAFGGNAAGTWNWQTAVLAGYAWDSTLQKIAKP